MRIENTWASQPLSGITTISAIRYEVDIQPPSSMPAPIAPWMSASEALTIWMLSTAMKAPSVAPSTAIQVLAETVLAETVLAETAGAAEAALACAWSAPRRVDAAALMVGWSAVIGVSSCLQRQDALSEGFR